MIAALIFTVALLVTTGYSLMGSVPLLILNHDTPLDSRFIRGFFNVYYLAATFTAAATSLSFALAGRPAFSAGAAALAVLATVLRAKVIPRMDQLRTRIQLNDIDAILQFRKTHIAVILINLVQLVAVVWSLTAFSL